MEMKLYRIGFKACVADLDVWLRLATKPYGYQYYEYSMMHVDNTLAIYTSTTKILKNLEVNTIIYKNGKITLLDMNLGYKIQHKAINIIEC